MSKNLSLFDDELFAGFDELRAVTFSAGVRQIEHVMKNFRRGEVIIGSHEQISVDLAEVLALQKFAVEFMSKNSYLQRRIAAREFKLYVTDRVHAKIYLMCADDGRCRVILTSANFSANAWQSRQRETFVVMDEPAAYEHYMSGFEELKNFSAEEIDVTARPLKDDGSNLEQLPAIKNAAYVKSAVVVHELPPESREEADYLLVQQATAQKFRTLFKEVDVHSDTHGKTLLVAEKIIRMKKIMRRTHEDDVARRKNNSIAPELLLDCDNLRVTFNDEPWDLNPSAAEVRADLQSLIEYVDGAEKFTGDVANLKTLYWKIVLYMFVSPFFARLRYFYSQLVPANSTGKTFPMYMILRGPKNGGKSSIVATGQKLMFDRILPTISAKDTAPSKIESFKLTVKGCPILIDDVTNRNLQYLKDIVKDDSSLISGKILDHGTFIFTGNDAEQIRQEISKRVVVFTVPNQLNEDVAARHDAALKKLQHKMHNALYRAYVAKIFPEVATLTEEIICGGKDDWLPDIFRVASETLIKIFREHELATPPELKIFTWADYLGEGVKSAQAVGTLERLFKFSRR
ncbi:MAG: NgoFVII family restriction endonuclease [Quinella sp. 1Q7]|nr:NgoFVII family restriction endonuclease [Quinella sp. 1Q7]